MLTVSIVLYKNPQMQIATVIKCVINSNCVKRIFLVDNSPQDSLRYLQGLDSRIEYIFNNGNLGYGAAHNIAIKRSFDSGCAYHVILNPDIYFESHVLSSLIDFMDKNPNAVYVLPKVKNPDGTIQCLCKLLPTPFNLIARRFLPKTKWINKIDNHYTLKEFGYDKIINPPCLSGCFMFLRLSTMEKNNILFDDNFFMYCEDFDLIRRLHRYGYTLYFPSVEIIHDHAQDSYHSIKMVVLHMKSAFKYFNKYGWFFDQERKLWNRKILQEIRKL